MTREEQLAIVAEHLINLHLKKNGSPIVTSDDGTSCVLAPLGAMLQLEDALEGRLERDDAA